MNKIVERIEREAGVPGLASILAQRLAPTDLQSLLLEVYRLRSSGRRPADLLSSYESDRFVRPSSVPPSRLLSWEQIAFSQLPPEFQPVALSPVCPLGTNSVVATVDQNWAVATARNTEVVSDSTNVLALECALRRRRLVRAGRPAEPVHLAASHRLLRAQRYQDPAALSHFGCFALCSAGRDPGSSRFELSSLGLHMRVYLKSLRTFLGPGVPLYLSATDLSSPSRNALLETQLLAPHRSEFEAVDCSVDPLRTGGRGYYLELCFHIHAAHPAERRLELVDGGVVDWTQRLLSDAKERLVISGIGSERLCSEFPDGTRAGGRDPHPVSSTVPGDALGVTR
jgi:hypothetical protein